MRAPLPLRAPETKDADAFKSPRGTEGARVAEGAWSIWFVRDRVIQGAEGP